MIVADERVLTAARYRCRCEACGRVRPDCYDPHHIFSRGAGRVDIPENVISLCRACHNRAHTGQISRLLLLVVAGHREKLLTDDIEENVWTIRRSKKCRFSTSEATPSPTTIRSDCFGTRPAAGSGPMTGPS